MSKLSLIGFTHVDLTQDLPQMGLMEQDLYQVDASASIGFSGDGVLDTDLFLIVRAPSLSDITDESLSELLRERITSDQNYLDMIEEGLSAKHASEHFEIDIHRIFDYKEDLVVDNMEE